MLDIGTPYSDYNFLENPVIVASETLIIWSIADALNMLPLHVLMFGFALKEQDISKLQKACD
jgi:hypothetical protein